MKRWLWFALPLAALFAWAPVRARADSSVVVLGVRSLDGDDELARQVSAALRDAAHGISGWNVSDRDVSLAQMSLAHGCEEPDARCMADIAGTLEVDRLVYGTMVRVGSEVQVSLFNFDAVTGQIEGSTEQKVAPDQLVEPALEGTMSTFVKRLAGEKVAGMLRVIGDTPNATVSIDGKPAGALDLRGELLVAEVAAGRHTVVVESSEPPSRRELPVVVGEASTATLRVVLRAPAASSENVDSEQPPPVETDQAPAPADEGRRLRRILGWTSIGLAGAMAIATAYTWVRIDSINDDGDLRAYRAQFPSPDQPGGTSDVCQEAKNGTLSMQDAGKASLESSARNLCDQASTLEVLQYVFLGTAVVAGGVGAYLLLSTPKDAKKGTLTWRPSFGVGRAQLSARLHF